MITGIVYILTAISIAVIVLVARKPGHEVLATSEVFRYQSGLLKVLYFCSFIPLLVNVVLIVVSMPKPSGIEMLMQMSFAILLTAMGLFWHLKLKRFSVEIGADGFVISKIRGASTVPLSAIERINLLEGGKGEHVLAVLGKGNKEIIRFSESIQDFDTLTELLRSHAKSMGIPFFYRDCHGKWSQ